MLLHTAFGIFGMCWDVAGVEERVSGQRHEGEEGRGKKYV